jgi:hypothetical protein
MKCPVTKLYGKFLVFGNLTSGCRRIVAGYVLDIRANTLRLPKYSRVQCGFLLRKLAPPRQFLAGDSIPRYRGQSAIAAWFIEVESFFQVEPTDQIQFR